MRGRDDVEDAVGLAETGFKGDAGEDALVGAGNDDMAAGRAAPGRNEAGQDGLQPLDAGSAVLPDRGEAVDALSKDVGERCDVALHRRALLPVVVDHLNEGAEADGDEEGDDQGGHSAA